jgi:imidazolonepropionase-like amidohydrolase
MQLAISASQVLPGPAGHRFHRGAVLLEDSSIVAVGSRDDIRAAAPDATELAYPEATIIPGLINAHVHLAFDPGPHRLERLTDNREAAEIALAMAGHARQLLDCGVTTARDPGDRAGLTIALRDAIAAGWALLVPRWRG